MSIKAWFKKTFHNHTGPILKVRYIHYTQNPLGSIGVHTIPMCRCNECGKIFEASEIPGRWTIEEIEELETYDD
jgi:hypothetical protein